MKPHTASGVLLVVALFAVPSVASAQEAGKTGVTIGYPAAVGILWHVTENIAVRPELNFSFSSTEGSTIESSTDAIAIGASALFYVKRWDAVSAYLSPRFAWNRTSTTAEASFFPGIDIDSNEVTGNAFLYSGSFGAQGWIGQRFSAFGEVGLAYTRGTAKSAISGFETTSNSVGTRAGVGVVLYF